MKTLGPSLLALILVVTGCAGMEETVRTERGPLLRTFERPRIVEGGIKGEVAVQWPKLILNLKGFDTCRTEKVEEYAEEKIHERKGAGAPASLSLGLVATVAGVVVLGVSGFLSGEPNTGVIDGSGHYGIPPRDTARGYGVAALCVGVPALVVAVVQFLHTGDEVETTRVEQIANQHDETCHERPMAGPLYLAAESGERSGPLAAKDGVLELDASNVTAPIEDFIFYERPVPLDDASQRLLDGFNGCVHLEHENVASAEALTTGGLVKRLEAARACKQVRGDEASAAEEARLKAEVSRRRQGGEAIASLSNSFDEAVTNHPPKLTIAVGSDDLKKLDDVAHLQGVTVLITGTVRAGLSPNIGVVRVGNRDLFIFIPPDAPWASESYAPNTQVQVIGVLAGLQTVGEVTAPLVNAYWMRKLP